MFRDDFYKTFEKAIKSTPIVREGSRNGLLDISNAVVSLKEALNLLPDLVQNLDNHKKALDHFFYVGGSLAALNYFRDNKTTPKNDFKRIKNLMDLVLSLDDELDNLYAGENLKKEKIRESYKKIELVLEMCLKESKSLLQEEIERWNLFSYLDSIKPENRISYLTHVFGKNKSDKINREEFILELYNKERN